MLKTFFKYCLPKCVVCSLPLPCLCVCFCFSSYIATDHILSCLQYSKLSFFQQFMFKHLFLIYALHWLTQLTLMAAVCWQWPSKLLSSVISLFWGNKTTKTKPFDRDLLLLPPSLSLTCIYSLMMSVKCSHECMKKKISDGDGDHVR